MHKIKASQLHNVSQYMSVTRVHVYDCARVCSTEYISRNGIMNIMHIQSIICEFMQQIIQVNIRIFSVAHAQKKKNFVHKPYL